MRAYRLVTTQLPVSMVYYFNAVTITPLQWLVSQIKGKKKKFTEVAIEQLDMLTPTYRHEHDHAEVMAWMKGSGARDIVITDTDDYGFSIKGVQEK